MPKSYGGQNGPHVEAIQKALKKINATWPAESKMHDITDPPGVYGQSTANAVRKYKAVNAIMRAGEPLDDIVGRMTMTRLDDELKNLHTTPVPPPRPLPPPVPPPEPGILPVRFCNQNTNIILDGTKAVKRSPPMRPAEWVDKTQAVFDTICANQLGKNIVEAIHEQVFIEPFLPNAVNAQSDGRVFIIFGAWVLEFTPDVFTPVQSQPGARADEVLLHEMIHMIEHNFSGYDDPADKSLIFDNADFLTVNGTNVYSTVVSRGLRKDHRGFVPMPTRYGTDAREHMILFREDYEKAFDNNQALFNLFKNQSASWNPMASFTRNVTKMQFLVEVSGPPDWKWHYDLFSDSTARWIDTQNVAEYGTGTWRQDGPDIVIDWKGGGFDRFPLAEPGQFVSGRDRAGGVERGSLVKRE